MILLTTMSGGVSYKAVVQSLLRGDKIMGWTPHKQERETSLTLPYLIEAEDIGSPNANLKRAIELNIRDADVCHFVFSVDRFNTYRDVWADFCFRKAIQQKKELVNKLPTDKKTKIFIHGDRDIFMPQPLEIYGPYISPI